MNRLQVPRGFPPHRENAEDNRTLYYRLAPQPRPAATEYRRPRTHIAQREAARRNGRMPRVPGGACLPADGHVVFSLALAAWGRHAVRVHEDHEACVRAVQSKDARFDGWFFTAVTTTGIYCRPSCPVVPPKPRTCASTPALRPASRPDSGPASGAGRTPAPARREWNAPRRPGRPRDAADRRRGHRPRRRARAGRPARLQRPPGRAAAARRAGRRPAGAGPRPAGADRAAADRDHRAAHGARSRSRPGSASIRTVQRHRPRGLRAPAERAARAGPARPGGAAGRAPGAPASLRLPFRAPLNPDNLFGHLAATAVPGVEEWRDGAYRRTLRLPHGHGIVALRARGPTTSPAG